MGLSSSNREDMSGKSAIILQCQSWIPCEQTKAKVTYSREKMRRAIQSTKTTPEKRKITCSKRKNKPPFRTQKTPEKNTTGFIKGKNNNFDNRTNNANPDNKKHLQIRRNTIQSTKKTQQKRRNKGSRTEAQVRATKKTPNKTITSLFTDPKPEILRTNGRDANCKSS